MKFALHFGNITFPDPADAKRMVQAGEVYDLELNYRRQESIYRHLEHTAAEERET